MALAEIFVNNVNTNLTAPTTSTDTVIKLASVVGFPTLTAGNYCRGVFTPAATPGSVYEYVVITAVDTTLNTITVVRGQEGATPQAWLLGDIFYVTDTAASLANLIQQGTGGAVSSFNGRGGAVTLLNTDVYSALGFTPTPTVGTSLLAGNGTGGFNNVTLGAGLTLVGTTLSASPVTIASDTATATAEFPLFANVTAGTATTIYTASPKYTFVPSTGNLTSSTVSAANCFFMNPANLPASFTVPAAINAMSVGPINTGAFVVTVPAGSNWVVV